MCVLDKLRKHKEEIEKLARSKGIHNIRIIGSVARKEETDSSDIDIIVDIDKDRSLFDLIDFKHGVEDIMGRKVDVGTDIHPYIKEEAMKDAVQL